MPHADGEGQAHVLIQRPHFVQNVKLARDHLGEMPLFHHGHITGAGHPAQKAGGAADVVLQQQVHALQQARPLRLPQVFQQHIRAVHLEQHVHRAAGPVLGGLGAHVGHIHQMHHGQAPVLVRRGGEHPPPAALTLQALPAGLAGRVQLQPGQHPAHRLKHIVLIVQQGLPEGIVVPQHGFAAQQHGRVGQPRQAELHAAALEHIAGEIPGNGRPQAAAPQSKQHPGRRGQQQYPQQQHRPLHGQRRAQPQAQHAQNDQQNLQFSSWLWIGLHGLRLLFCNALRFGPNRQKRPAAPQRGRESAFRPSLRAPNACLQRQALRSPSEWAGSWGCAWFSGKYRRRVPPARGS